MATANDITGQTRGVYTISPTPFTERGEIDFKSTDMLVDFYLNHDVDGLTILGMLGEASKLSPAESSAFMGYVLARMDGRKPVIIGASNAGTDNLVTFAREARDKGAAGIMVAPVAGLNSDERVYDYWARLLERLGPDIPVCYQDYPKTTGVSTSVEVLNRLIDGFENLVMLKHEQESGLGKITRIRETAAAAGRRRISILIGNGGLYLSQELGRGVDGAMTGFAFPEMLVQVCRAFFDGKADAAEDIFDIYLPILRYEQQFGIGLAIRKEILRRRGAIASATVRHPGPLLNDRDHAEIGALLARLERKLAAAQAGDVVPA